jgi:hypothetical protein
MGIEYCELHFDQKCMVVTQGLAHRIPRVQFRLQGRVEETGDVLQACNYCHNLFDNYHSQNPYVKTREQKEEIFQDRINRRGIQVYDFFSDLK